MQVGELLFAKALAPRQRHRQRVAERERGRRARRRRQVHRARFFGHVAAQRDVRRLAERRVRIAGERDQARAGAADRLEQPHQLFGLAAVRQRDHDVVRPDDAEVAVNGLGGMQEERRRARCSRTSPPACAR